MALYNGFAMIMGVAPLGTATVEMGKIEGSTPATQVFGYAQAFLDDAPIQHQSTFTEHIGADGETAALQWVNERLAMTITFRPASNVSQAEANAQAYFIPKGAIVRLSGFRPVKSYRNNAASTGAGNVIGDVLNYDATKGSSAWVNCGDATLTLHSSAAAEVQLDLRNYLEHQADITKPITPETAIP